MTLEQTTYPIIPPNLAKMRLYKGIPIPQPSIEHTLVRCDVCGNDGWIGPAQLMALTFRGGAKICYWCLGTERDAGSEIKVSGMLDRTADEKPRRT